MTRGLLAIRPRTTHKEPILETLALLLVVPLLWPFIAKAIWKHELTVREIAINLAVGAAIVILGWAGGRYAQTHDVELLNGEVLRKESHRVSCEHSYECNCTSSTSTDSQGRTTTTKSCSTCYEHTHDVDHTLYTNVGDIDIDRVDRQGLTVPPRFTKAAVGDPVAKSHNFVNYVKAAPESLFNTLAEKAAYAKFDGHLPPYPDEIHDYHYANRVLVVGAKVPDAAEWNAKLAGALKKLGPAKHANAVLVFTADTDPNYAQALHQKWLGGKKNDIIVVIGAPSYPEVEWARVVTWSDSQLFKVQLQDAIQDLKTVTPDSVIALLTEQTMKGFERKKMSDFEYLKWEIAPPTWLLALLFVLSLVASVVTSIKLANNSESSGGYMPRRFARNAKSRR
ncbi:hypothetical protein [Variovorax sp. PBL-H6]|uniref:hypothetical protein n=1 Tax=Variovorax sp. PBL-H6 TaxID=434009 RepID=UPI0013A59EED|nr:hypothetical protein [Variovorax sp. PBL-H6]